MLLCAAASQQPSTGAFTNADTGQIQQFGQATFAKLDTKSTTRLIFTYLVFFDIVSTLWRLSLQPGHWLLRHCGKRFVDQARRQCCLAACPRQSQGGCQPEDCNGATRASGSPASRMCGSGTDVSEVRTRCSFSRRAPTRPSPANLFPAERHCLSAHLLPVMSVWVQALLQLLASLEATTTHQVRGEVAVRQFRTIPAKYCCAVLALLLVVLLGFLHLYDKGDPVRA